MPAHLKTGPRPIYSMFIAFLAIYHIPCATLLYIVIHLPADFLFPLLTLYTHFILGPLSFFLLCGIQLQIFLAIFLLPFVSYNHTMIAICSLSSIASIIGHSTPIRFLTSSGFLRTNSVLLFIQQRL